MKNETARREIESLDYYLQNHTDDYSEESHTAMMMAIKALGQEPCEDAISRQAVLDGLASIAKVKARSDVQKSLMGRVMFFVEQLPLVTPQPKTGHWISDAIQGEIDGQIVKAFICSECGAISVFRITDGKIVNGDLCPNCGAKMQESEEV